MGTCLFAADAVGVGGDSGGRSKPVAAASRAASRAGGRGAGGASFSSGNVDNDEEEEGGNGGPESRAARSVLLSGVQRWCLDVSEWGLSADQWDGLLGLLPNAESARVRAFLRENDRKLALGSRLLQRALVSKVFGLEFDEIDIRRTAESKPFFAGVVKAIDDGSVSPLLKNWNFNVSHHGKYVAVASEPACLCGVDVVDTNRRANEQGPAEDYLQYFTGHFTDDEWTTIKSPADDVEKLRRFYIHWGLKEAYVKAIGQGLGYDLRRVSFLPGDWVDCWFCLQEKQRWPRRCPCPRSLAALDPATPGGQQVGGCGTVDGTDNGTDADSGSDCGRGGGRGGESGGVGGVDRSCGGDSKVNNAEGKGIEAEKVRANRRNNGDVVASEGRASTGADAGAAEGRRGGFWGQEDRLGCACGMGAVTVKVDNVLRPDWSFKVFSLPDGYAACVARGPPSACSPSGQEAGVISDAHASERGQSLPQLRFRKVGLEEIVPPEAAARLFGEGRS
ncbi:unnamed protein product [Ectocarpus sp. CCAP 1310/34]|nr:unnamed protein product [Ectocarpus sp. CCAP 1310/34]